MSASLAGEETTEEGTTIATICIAVRDTGIGILHDQQETLFDPFIQAGTSTSRRFGGTGLGLAITNRLGEMQKGSIVVESEPGKGTTFPLHLPFPVEDTSSSARQAEYENVPHLQFTGKKILLVEDNYINQQVAEEILSSRGIEVSTCDNGREAVTLLQKKQL